MNYLYVCADVWTLDDQASFVALPDACNMNLFVPKYPINMDVTFNASTSLLFTQKLRNDSHCFYLFRHNY